MSDFRICITRSDGEPIYLYPGSTGERDLVLDLVRRVKEKGVGFKTESHVIDDITNAINELLLDMKTEIVPPRR